MHLELTFFILSIVYVLIINRIGRYCVLFGWRVFWAPLHGAFGISCVITALYFAGEITGAQWVTIWRVFQVAFIPFLWLTFKPDKPDGYFDDIRRAMEDLQRAVDDNIRRAVLHWRH